MPTETPFRIGSHVTGPFFTDRADEVRRIVEALRAPTRLLVFGPRRMGKSSAIAVATERARRDGVLVVRADLSTASGLVDVANRLLHSLSRQRVRERLVEFAAALGPNVTLTFDSVSGAPRIVFGVGGRSAPAERQHRSLERVVERLAEQLDGRESHVAVVLDEFQGVRRFGGETGEWRLRDLMQRHGELSFVCAGSEVSLIEAMLAPERAFFRTFELLQMGPIDSGHLATWIDSRLETAGVEPNEAGAEIIERVGPRTQDILQVARHVYAAARARSRGVEPGAVEAAVDEVVREEDPVIRQLWIGLTTHQQNVIRAVASGVDHLFSARVRERFGLPTSSSVAAAVDALEKKGLLTRDSESGEIEFESPFVRIWAEEEVLRDVPPE